MSQSGPPLPSLASNEGIRNRLVLDKAASQKLTTVSEKVLMEVIQLFSDRVWAGAVLSQLKVKKHVDL